MRPIGNTVYLMPPYAINDGEIDQLVDSTLATLKAVTGHEFRGRSPQCRACLTACRARSTRSTPSRCAAARQIAETACAPEQTLTLAGATARAPCSASAATTTSASPRTPHWPPRWAEGAALYGTGSGGSHLILGHSRAHALLEERLAGWMAPFIPEAQSLFFCTGYMANLAVLSALGGAEAVIFSSRSTTPR